MTAWRLVELAFDAPPVSFDEAQYWAWARHPQFGYYSKPPLVAWVIAITTGACGDAPGCIKLGSTLAHAGTAIVLFHLGRALFDERAGAWAAVLWVTLPAVSLSSMVISTDPFLLVFWALAMLCLVKAAERGPEIGRWWLGLGLAVGFGLLAKYAMILFAASLALWLALCPDRRWLLRARGLWAAAGVAVAVYLPNLAWNAANGFVSYAHTRDNANLGGTLGNPGKLAEFVAGQFGVFGPLTMAALLAALAASLKRGSDARLRMLAAFALPFLLIMAVQSFLSRANANWTGPAYVAGTLLVAAWLPVRAAWVMKASVALHLLAAGVLYNAEELRAGLGLPNVGRLDPMKRLRGWDEIGAQVSAHLAAVPGARLMGDDRKTLASLLYYVRPHPFDLVKWNPGGEVHDHFDLTTRLDPGAGPFVWVTRMDEMAIGRVSASFERAERLGEIRLRLHEDFERRTSVLLVDGFKGYR